MTRDSNNKKNFLSKCASSILSHGLIAIVFAVVLLFIATRSANEVVYQWKQPKTLKYDGEGPYYVSIIKGSIDWNCFPPERDYYFWASRDSGEPGYGHKAKYSFYWDSYSEGFAEFLAKSEVNWSKQGVHISLNSGHELFIPEGMFTGGR